MFSRIALVAALTLTCLPNPAWPQARSPGSILIDTDIGSDIDDAFALAFALGQWKGDVTAVTTVGDQPDDRAWIVCRFLTHAGFAPISVAAGAEPQPKLGIDWQIQYRRHPAPLFNRTQKPEKLTAERWFWQRVPDKFVSRSTTILALGPLTNIARMIEEHPEAARCIRHIVIMGGSFDVGYDGKKEPEPEWNIKSDIAAARAVLKSDIELTFVPLDAAVGTTLDKAARDRLFSAHSPLSFQVQTLYELWDRETPVLYGCAAVAALIPGDHLTYKNARIEIDDRGMTRIVDGPPNARIAIKGDGPKIVELAVDAIRGVGKTSLPTPPKNASKLIDRGGFPAKVHVAEDYDTDIEKRWWMAGKAETKDVPAGGRRSQRGVLTQDFDDRQGQLNTPYRAVIFNPVPGPPMGKNTRLSFRYKLIGTDVLRVQLYSLTNGYHRYLSISGLPQNEWREGAVEMAQMRRPDGSGGPLAENERIDDIQFYVDPRADVLIDDVILYDAARDGETRPFPKRIVFTGWFDTGKFGKEWLGDFAIVDHVAPRKWKAARSVAGPGDSPWLRLDLKGPRRLGAVTDLDFQYHIANGGRIDIELRDRSSKRVWRRTIDDLVRDAWSTASVRFEIPEARDGDSVADEIRFLATKGATLTLDDVLLYEPSIVPAR